MVSFNRFSFCLLALSVVFFSLHMLPVSAQESFVVTVGQDKVFTEFNYHDSWFEDDPNNPLPWPDWREAYSEANVTHVSMEATPGHAGVAQARTGTQFEWDLGENTWEKVQNWPVKIAFDFSYQIVAYWVEGTGSANSQIVLQTVSGPYDIIGREAGYPGSRSQTVRQTFGSTLDGHQLTVRNLEEWGRRIFVGAYCQAHSTSEREAINYSSATVTINNVEIEFGLMGDVNNDSRVDIFDLVTVAKAFGSTPENPNWNPAADLNGDGKVDIFDLVIVAKNFGRSAQ